MKCDEKGAEGEGVVGGEGEREFRGGGGIENRFAGGTSKREGRQRDKGEVGKRGGRQGEKSKRRCSSVTARATEHCGTARLFAMVPIQRLITVIISQLLTWGLRCEMLQPCKRLVECVCVCVCVQDRSSHPPHLPPS